MNIILSEINMPKTYLVSEVSDTFKVFFNEYEDFLNVKIELFDLRQKDIVVKVENEFLKVSYTPHVVTKNKIEHKSPILSDRLIELPDNIDKERFTIYFSQDHISLIFQIINNIVPFNMYY
jgi:HSP20 family molecular chaperone IbpA